MPKAKFGGIEAKPSRRFSGRTPPPGYAQVRRQFEARKTDQPIVSNITAIALCVDNQTRIRLSTLLAVLGLNQGLPYYERVSLYLDGQMLVETLYGNGIVERKWDFVGENVIPTRSKEVIDFGRLDQAVQGLVTIMGRINESGQAPTDDQMSSLYISRENVLEWQRRAHAEMATADSQIDLMEGMFRQVVLPQVRP
jgi:hypothetical protein